MPVAEDQMDCLYHLQSQQDFSQLMQMPGVRKRAFLGGSPRWRQLQRDEMIGMKAGARGASLAQEAPQLTPPSSRAGFWVGPFWDLKMRLSRPGGCGFGFVFFLFLFLPVTGSALQGRRPPGAPSLSPSSWGFICLFVCSLVPCPELQGEGPRPPPGSPL